MKPREVSALLVRTRKTVKRGDIMLNHALRGPGLVKKESWRVATLGPPADPMEKEWMERLLHSVESVKGFIDECEKRGDHQTLQVLVAFGSLASLEMGIRPGDWYLRHYAPVLRQNKKRTTNRNKASADRKADADKAVLAVFDTWVADNQKRVEGKSTKDRYRLFYNSKPGKALSPRKMNRLRVLLGLTKK
jgi:hypothetical protein